MSESTYDVFSQMQTGEPFKVFKKAHSAKLLVRVLNPFSNDTEEVILTGEGNDQEQFLELWNERDYQFFKRRNKKALESGWLIEVTDRDRDYGEIEPSANTLSDKEIAELVTSPFIKLKNTVESMTSEAAIARVVDAAEEAGRPEKTMKYLRERLSFFQSGAFHEEQEQD